MAYIMATAWAICQAVGVIWSGKAASAWLIALFQTGIRKIDLAY